MAFKLAVASGKGGTGKTSVSVLLHHFITGLWTKNVQIMDCDVEEPNTGIFFQSKKLVKSLTISQMVPKIDNEKCVYCKKCADYCAFNAIVVIPSAKYVNLDQDLCHSCGACLVACEHEAITEGEQPIGLVKSYALEGGLIFNEGQLRIGSAMQTLVIHELKKTSESGEDVIIYDAPPGTSCPVVKSIADVNYVVLVTEPTPFGLHDLKLSVELMGEMEKDYGVVINKAGIDFPELDRFLEQNQVEVLGTIAFNPTFAREYAHGNLLAGMSEKMKGDFGKIVERLHVISRDYA